MTRQPFDQADFDAWRAQPRTKQLMDRIMRGLDGKVQIRDLDERVVGRRIRVTAIAPSQAESLGYVDDSRLVGQTGEATALLEHTFTKQLVVRWDSSDAGRLMLADHDEVEVIG